ncbi:MAG: L-serine ammonia-lyase, iron-sulfur-dependent subunit beta [Caldilineales bacterium]|nr:L-serine ammonia-lyase, iron-sulfur-dependent subunit beta [Caldilineales bacterium]MDW8318635.1 L-serine ammonia-lyase, iron-sulfur-dependent subunit beta [Anaerolineae bacterium]
MSRDVSVFDIIGPIMVGPSSSHTAGAVRLGQVARAVLGSQPTEALIELHGSFAQTGKGHGTDRGIVAGLLGLATDDPRLRHSFDLAEQAGLRFTIAAVDLGEDAHPNTARITVSDGRRTVQVVGASVGGGLVEIRQVDGYAVSFGCQYDTLLVVAEDRPGTVSQVTGWLAKRGINIAFLRVERDRRGGEAIMVIETDNPIDPVVLEALEDYPWVRWVRQVPRVEA